MIDVAKMLSAREYPQKATVRVVRMSVNPEHISTRNKMPITDGEGFSRLLSEEDNGIFT